MIEQLKVNLKCLVAFSSFLLRAIIEFIETVLASTRKKTLKNFCPILVGCNTHTSVSPQIGTLFSALSGSLVIFSS